MRNSASAVAAGRYLDNLDAYRLSIRSSSSASPAILPSLFLSCAASGDSNAAAQLHARSLVSGLLSDPRILTSISTTYSRLHLLPLARQLFDEVSNFPRSFIPSTLIVCYNAIISGYSLHSINALNLFVSMRRSSLPFNTITMLALIPTCPHASPSLHACNLRAGMMSFIAIGNCLVTSYSRIGLMEEARQMFDEASERRDLVTWNAMISGYAQNGFCSQVLDLFTHMLRSPNIRPDAVTLVAVLSSCANLGSRAIGRDIECFISGSPSLSSNLYLKNALVSFNARCGNISKARQLFDEMPVKSVISWTAIIAGYGMHGHGDIAVQTFENMLSEGVRPDGVAMVSVLTACSHAGLADTGMKFFSDMEETYDLHPGVEHYACAVDLLGRSGRLDEALDLIESMPIKPDGSVWGALLGACKIHKNVKMGEAAFRHAIELDPNNAGYYVIMSNIYLESGKLSGVVWVRSAMRAKRMKKEPGHSYIELKGKIHMFMADDHSHPESKKIYKMIDELEGKQTRAENSVFGYHSEKLAVAFGLMKLEKKTEILVMKNLRICGECHGFMKMVSEVADRAVVVRDASRFHHFQGGDCSCKDYW